MTISKPRADELKPFVSLSCDGERCHCGAEARHKVEETIFWDDPIQSRHPLTTYLCHEHFVQIMGPAARYPTERDRAKETARVEISFGYTNWRGETSHRRALPISIRFGSSDYHKRDQWLMLAHDLDKDAEREFAMCDMLLVEPANAILALLATNSGGGR